MHVCICSYFSFAEQLSLVFVAEQELKLHNGQTGDERVSIFFCRFPCCFVKYSLTALTA